MFLTTADDRNVQETEQEFWPAPLYATQLEDSIRTRFLSWALLDLHGTRVTPRFPPSPPSPLGLLGEASPTFHLGWKHGDGAPVW